LPLEPSQGDAEPTIASVYPAFCELFHNPGGFAQ
jgi:hypothetical protein